MNKIDTFSCEYLRIALEIDKHMPGYVETYYGPQNIKESVNESGKIPPKKLREDLNILKDHIPADDKSRHRYLTVTLRAFDCAVRRLMGEKFEYLDEVNRISDISPNTIDEASFDIALKELNALLPGQEELSDRIEKFDKNFEIKAEQTLLALYLAKEEVRRRTKDLFDLVEGEKLLLSCKAGIGGNANYLGNFCSQVEIYTSIPVSAIRLTDIMAHEAYPGHHTEAQLKDSIFHLQKGYGECAIVVLATPMCVVGEGIGMTASEVIFPKNSRYEWDMEVLFPALDIQIEYSTDQLQKYHQAKTTLDLQSRRNAAILYNTRQLNQKQTIDYLRTYSLEPQDKLQHIFNRISDPVGRTYVFNHGEGYYLISEAAQKYNNDKMPIFKRLLHEQVLPSDICNL